MRSTNATVQCRKPIVITFPGYSLYSACTHGLHATVLGSLAYRQQADGSSLSSVPLSGHLHVANYCYVGTAWVEPLLNSAEGKWIGFMLAVNYQWTNDN